MNECPSVAVMENKLHDVRREEIEEIKGHRKSFLNSSDKITHRSDVKK